MGLVIIGHRSSKSTFGANNNIKKQPEKTTFYPPPTHSLSVLNSDWSTLLHQSTTKKMTTTTKIETTLTRVALTVITNSIVFLTFHCPPVLHSDRETIEQQQQQFELEQRRQQQHCYLEWKQQKTTISSCSTPTPLGNLSKTF